MQEESVVFQDENANPFDTPSMNNMASEILVESKTLSFSPSEIRKSALKNSAIKSGKSVRIHSPSLKQTATELLRKQTPRRPFRNLTSTPF
jgi:hypothetical protein